MTAKTGVFVADPAPNDSTQPAPGWFGALRARSDRLHPVAAVICSAVSGYLVICVVFAGIGLVITDQLGALTSWDEHVNRWFADNRTMSINGWTEHVTRVADTSGILVVLVMAIIVLLVMGMRWDAVLLTVALALELLTFLTINYLVGRPRPAVERLGALPSTSSFPSGHTAATLVLYGGLAVIVSNRLRSRLAAVICWLFAVMATAVIGVARVYRGMHHPSDVAAGALVGLAVLAVAVVATRAGEHAAMQRRAHRAPPNRSFEAELAP